MDRDLVSPDLLNPSPDQKPDRDFHDQKLFKHLQCNSIIFFKSPGRNCNSIRIGLKLLPENMTFIIMNGVGYFFSYTIKRVLGYYFSCT